MAKKYLPCLLSLYFFSLFSLSFFFFSAGESNAQATLEHTLPPVNVQAVSEKIQQRTEQLTDTVFENVQEKVNDNQEENMQENIENLNE